jgi:thiamine biosynthesis lipoprotein
LQATRAFIDECERRFSRFIDTSELSQLNRSAGEWTAVSDDLLDMLQQSLHFYNETRGLFDPSILPDLKSAGYDKSMDEIRKNGVSTHIASKRTPRPALSEMEFDLPEKRVRLPRGMEIDLGGIAKGWIVDKAAELLSTYSSNCAVSAGGDIRFIGYPMGLLNWQVEVEDPHDPTQTAAVLHVGEGAVVTSSITKRRWTQSGRIRHHLINPRTGEPAESIWSSVTVIAPDILVAEVYAKALLIGGEKEIELLIERHPEVAYLTVDMEGFIGGSTNIKDYLNEFNYFPQ